MYRMHSLEEYERLQKAVDRVTPAMFEAFKTEGVYEEEEAFRAYREALPKAFSEAEKTEADLAIWHVYNMGFLVKSKALLFSIDLSHPDSLKFAPALDLAMITHNHEDHYQRDFYEFMNDELHRTVINNFEANTGANCPENPFGGGFTRGGKTYRLGDVEIITGKADHNAYLREFTMTYEIHAGGKVLYHTGDCCTAEQLNPTEKPDIWFVHPYCGMKVQDGYRRFRPELTVIGHIDEMSHSKDKWRWTYQEAFDAAESIEKLGGKALVPLWGDRIV